MGMFSKLAFWKKDDDFDFDNLAQKDLDLGMGKNGTPIQDNLGLDEKSPFADHTAGLDAPTTNPYSPQSQTPTPITPPAPTGMGDRDLELISSKLDTVKAILTSMDQRIANLEVAAGVNKNKESNERNIN